MRAPTVVADLRRSLAPRAPAMIVTLYGDVVLPRGRILWMGSLIELCGRLGLSESLVRTAVSRLVAAERLEGERDGRRSYYRLAAAAEAEFAAASERLYRPPAAPEAWALHYAPGLSDADARTLGRLGPDVFLRPDDGSGAGPAGIAFRAAAVAGLDRLPALAAALWPLGRLAADYSAMIGRFAPVAALEADPGDALLLRLMLVHDYRSVLLRDPMVPASALPADWPGPAAQRLFRSLYVALSPAADAAVGASLEGRAGLLPAWTDGTRRRLALLS